MTAESATRARMTLDIGLEVGNGWHRHQVGSVTLWAKGYLVGDTFDHLARRLAASETRDRAAVGDILAGLDGHWALAATAAGWALAAVDRVRSIPLIWARAGSCVVVDQEGGRIARRLNLSPSQIDLDAAIAVALAGYTIGDDTLYRKIHQLGPGSFLFVDAAAVETLARHHRWEPWHPDETDSDDLVTPLTALHERLIEKLIASANGRTILVPLSAGLDSRFIASGLREADYNNVVCFAYGTPDNREAVVSRRIGERLGYPWHFVPYSSAAMRAAFASDDHVRFRAKADSLTGIHFPQDYLALKHLIDDGIADTGSIVVNGQSGDFITGNHIPDVLTAAQSNRSHDARRRTVIEALLAKHFKQWDVLCTPVNMACLAERLAREIDTIGMPTESDRDHGIYEYCEFQDRQAKYVIGGQRVYEHFGMDWRLPLWDQAYLDFWERAPLAAKVRQGLYRSVLHEQNWGGVWGDDIPVNPTRIRPLWLWPIRLGLKALHAPLGRARWHAFERRYLAYWMSPICPYGGHSWSEVARDNRGHWSGISWHIKDYLADKGVRLDDLVG